MNFELAFNPVFGWPVSIMLMLGMIAFSFWTYPPGNPNPALVIDLANACHCGGVFSLWPDPILFTTGSRSSHHHRRARRQIQKYVAQGHVGRPDARGKPWLG